MKRPHPLRRAVLCAAAVLSTLSLVRAADPAATAREGEDLYRKGAYAEALKRFESALASGYETPALLYQAGTCYGQTMQNRDKELELKRRAIPLLEKEIAAGSASLDSYYYLAAIYINDLNDPVKGTDVARKGAAMLEKSKASAPTSQEGAFRAGKLYSFLGKDKEATAWYDASVRAARAPGAAVDRASLKRALEEIASFRYHEKTYDAAAAAYEDLLKLDPPADSQRHQLGLALLGAGRPQEAVAAWQAAHGDDMRTELNYLMGVVRKWMAAGQPATSKAAPKFATLDDEALQQKILATAEPLRKIREKEAKEQQAREEAEQKAREEAKQKRQDEIKAKGPGPYKVKWKRIEGADPNFNETPTDPWAALYSMGIKPTQLPPPPPASAEKVAAEKEFFVLMLEYVKRGRFIRTFCFDNGLIELIFR